MIHMLLYVECTQATWEEREVPLSWCKASGVKDPGVKDPGVKDPGVKDPGVI